MRVAKRMEPSRKRARKKDKIGSTVSPSVCRSTGIATGSWSLIRRIRRSPGWALKPSLRLMINSMPYARCGRRSAIAGASGPKSIGTANQSTTCPMDTERVVSDSKADARLSYPLPVHWSAGELTARRLTVNGREPFPLQILDGQIVVDIPARVPVMVYAREDAIATPAATQSA